MSTTEVAVFPLKAGANIGDPSTPAAGVLKNTFDTLRQQDGMQQIQFGTWVENPSMFQLCVNWDSKKHHETFMKSDTYKPFLERILTLVDGDPSIFHVDFQPPASLAKAFAAPVTEIATFYFDGAPPEDYMEGVQKLAKVFEQETPEGFLASAGGITYEEVEREGVKGKAAVVAVGWQSVEGHMAFRQSQSFKDNIHLLRSNSQKIEMHHVAFMQSQADM